MTTYDSTVGARPNIGDAAQDSLNGSGVKQALLRTKETAASATSQAGDKVRKRPVVSSVGALAVAAVAAGSVIGGRRLMEARRPRSRWQRLMDQSGSALSRFKKN